LQAGRDRARPEGAGGHRGERPGGVRQDRRDSEGRATQDTRLIRPELVEAFREQARACEQNGSPLYGRVCRECAELSVVDEIVVDPDWHAPLRLLGGIHYLALAEGIDPWGELAPFLEERREWLASFVAQQGVQTNEVRRCWALLPAFLSIGERRLDLVELGPSAGLNLLWDRYGYEYAAGTWGEAEAPLSFSGDERAPVPRGLLERRPAVARRRGIDLDPVDVTTEHGARLLQCFVWADQHERLERLRRAITVVRRDRPELIRGDYVDVLPSVLAERAPDALVVVFETASLGYLEDERYAELRRVLEEAERPLAWIATRRWPEREEDTEDGYELETAVWPDRAARLVARMGFHGQWLEWRG